MWVVSAGCGSEGRIRLQTLDQLDKDYSLGDPRQLLSEQQCTESRGALSKTQASICVSNLYIKFTRWLSRVLRYSTSGGLCQWSLKAMT